VSSRSAVSDSDPGAAVYAVYGATKAALSYLSESIRGELAPLGVRITNIEPGLTDTELREHVAPGEARDLVDGMFESLDALSADDVADLIAYAVTRPRHVNIPQLAIMPTAQA
jgi:NADP-dependent 3-hydroxy acid dehydrogenase YdfG